MNAKERKQLLLTKDAHMDKEMSPRLRGRVLTNADSPTGKPRRVGRKKQVVADADGSPDAPPRSPAPGTASPSLRAKKEKEKEKEAENTIVDIDGFSLIKLKQDDETSSVRSIASSLRARNKTLLDPEDDAASLKSIKREDDEGSVRSYSGRGRPKNTTEPKLKATGKSKKEVAKKTKDVKVSVRKQTKRPSNRFLNKLDSKNQTKKTTILIKKKVQKAQNTVKRARKQAVIVKNGAVIKGRPVKRSKKPKASAETRKAGKSNEDCNKKKAVDNNTEKPVKRKRNYDKTIQFETMQSPDDSSVIIVQPRLGPKVPKLIAPKREPDESQMSVAVPKTSPAMVTANSASTPYLIQSMPNFSMANPPSNIPGEVLVTPTGLVLIKAVTPSEQRNVRLEQNSEPKYISLTPVVSPAVANVQADSILSEKAKEAEPAQDVLELHQAAKSADVLNTTRMSADDQIKPKLRKPLKIKRRASHDGVFGGKKLSKPRRSGSYDPYRSSSTLSSPYPPSESDSEPVFLNNSTMLKKTKEMRNSALHSEQMISSKDAVHVFVKDSSAVKDEHHQPSNSSLFELENLPNLVPLSCLSVPAEPSIMPSETKPLVPSTSSNRTRPKKISKSLDIKDKQSVKPRRHSNPEPRIINIVTSKDGKRQGKNLMEEIRQQTLASVPSETEVRPSVEVSAVGPKVEPSQSSNSPGRPKKSLLTNRYSLRVVPKMKKIIIDRGEDSTKKELILGALGLYKLEVAAGMEAERKRRKEQLKQQQAALAAAPSNGSNSNYTGTLKTVIKIQRPEKRGSGKMIYRASSSVNSSHCLENGHADETDQNEITDKEDAVSGDDLESHKTFPVAGGKAVKPLVIPEKASSFSIHPQRMCSDVCTYCFGKFGLLDTPCHIAQLKGAARQANILATETHLTADSCLCDACFRHVDKKSNQPSQADRKPKRKLIDEKAKRCAVGSCDLPATFSYRRKSILKLKKSLGRKMALDPERYEKTTGYMSIVWFCNEHREIIDYYLSCGICKKRLTGVNMYQVGADVHDINMILTMDDIPTSLNDKRFLCKFCQFYTHIRLRCRDPKELNNSHRQYHESWRKRVLRCYECPSSDEIPREENGEILADTTRNGKNYKAKKTCTKSPTSDIDGDEQSEENKASQEQVVVTDSGKPSPQSENSASDAEDCEVRAKFRMHSETSQTGFQKCTATIQFTENTKNMFFDMQRPYGNQSSFFRHLVFLEKYFRSGDLVLAPNADPSAAKYLTGVYNRLRSYEGLPPLDSAPQASSQSTQTIPPLTITPIPAVNPLSQIEATVQSIGLHNKPEISISSVPATDSPSNPPNSSNKTSPTVTLMVSATPSSTPAPKLTPKLQENLRVLASKGIVRASTSASASPTARAVILNRNVGGLKHSFVQVSAAGKTIHLTLNQFRRIQQMQLRKKLEQKKIEEQAQTSNGQANGNNVPAILPKALKITLRSVNDEKSFESASDQPSSS